MIAVRDLQIGDFINTENNGVVQITVLSWKGVGYEGGASTPEHCSYIPLTSDILVKNGWRKHIMLYKNEWYGDIGLFEEHGKFYYMDLKIEYVHQLQHLLRLVGIKNEVQL